VICKTYTYSSNCLLNRESSTTR